jgi:hypothetical protein
LLLRQVVQEECVLCEERNVNDVLASEQNATQKLKAHVSWDGADNQLTIRHDGGHSLMYAQIGLRSFDRMVLKVSQLFEVRINGPHPKARFVR